MGAALLLFLAWTVPQADEIIELRDLYEYGDPYRPPGSVDFGGVNPLDLHAALMPGQPIEERLTAIGAKVKARLG